MTFKKSATKFNIGFLLDFWKCNILRTCLLCLDAFMSHDAMLPSCGSQFNSMPAYLQIGFKGVLYVVEFISEK